jgi:divalent metal cation (Fe/Co/Zn/Cd) transporter
VAALLTFFAIRVAARPADVTHQFGHGKAEHLSALAEAGFLVVVSLFISLRALERLWGASSTHVSVTWYALVVIGVVLVIDATRATVSYRTSRRYQSVALASNALHFGSDFLGSAAVLAGLLAARGGYQEGDAIAALFVGVLVLLGASRLIKLNVDVLMDRAPADAEAAALAAIRALRPTVERALPNADVVVHVEPQEDATLRERVHAAAVAVPRVREVHNISLVDVGGRTELSLHLKLPGELSLDDAHEVAEQLERAICEAIPEIAGVQTHLEPLTEASEAAEVDADAEALVLRVVREETGRDPRELRFLRTDGGLVAFLTLGLDGASRLDDAHARASDIEERIRRERPDVADVIVHTEP